MTGDDDRPQHARTDGDEIEPPERFVAYEGDATIKTPYSTRRSTTTAEDPFPFPLGPTVCTASEVLAHKNTHLGENELEIYYSSTGDRVIYDVEPPVVEADPDASIDATAGGND